MGPQEAFQFPPVAEKRYHDMLATTSAQMLEHAREV